MSDDATLPNLLDRPELGYSFYSKLEYFAELRRLIDRTTPGSRVLLMTMAFEPDQAEIARLLTCLEAAAGRGVEVTLAVDAHSFMMDDRRMGPLWYGRSVSDRPLAVFRRKRAALNRLDSYVNARVVILNKPARRFSLPVAGRSHIKVAIIDNAVFVGGCNLDKPEYIDLMIGWNDTGLADELYGRMISIIDIGNVRDALVDTDVGFALNTQTKLLIDAGVRDQSRIFADALAMIDSATQWLTITCQFFPNSITAQHLLRARQRGVKVDIIYSHPRHHGLVGGAGQQLSNLLERSRLPAEMFSNGLGADGPMIHAKVIACDKGLMIGSHNYVRAGVRLGTAEIALKSQDSGLAERAANIIRQSIKLSTL